ncbi:MAG TPA: trypsin-like peptidase domain-containing protein [Pyrinomonadaceae bacterium]|jgi:S1-C subfamily serine protease|nr:trypsin-like peptidase domain-containing protein [Pyrinomonadaceae bacterium]
MATGLVIHISSGDDRHTEILSDDSLRIGASESCDLRLRSSSLPKNAANTVLLELSRKNGSYRVTDFDPALSLTLNGEPVHSGNEIHDGDELRIGDSALVLHFFPVRDLPAVVPHAGRETHVAPFIEAAAIESAATARRDDAKVFLREFTRELVREINPSTKLITLGIAVALVGGMLYLGFAMYKELKRSRNLIDEQSKQLTQMKDQVSKTNEQIVNIDESTKQLQNSLSLAVKLRSDYGSGVCLIAGSFYFVEAGTGRPLRYAEAQLNDSGSAVQSGAPDALTPEGNAAIAEYEFVGTGFHIGQGFVLTNRHIAQPWIADDRAQSISGGLKAQPRLRKLIAYFPNIAQAIPLKFKGAGQRDDLAVCSLDIAEIPETIPILPLETDPDAVAVGKTVVMMGYPSGPDRLLALLDDAESRGIQQRYGTPMAQLAYLAETKRIQPLTTQGSITDLDVRRIVYDARTAEGGSGAPLFGPSGRVIGVNFAVFTENQASNFAVPIRFSIPLLERSGWQAPAKETKDSESAGQTSSHTGQSGSR